MTTDHAGYPLPTYAATIWLAGDVLCIALPSGEAGKSHTVRIPVAKCSIETSEWGEPLARQRGWLVLLDILKERSRLRENPATMATRAAPVQYDIDALLVAMQPRKFDDQGKEQATYENLFEGDE